MGRSVPRPLRVDIEYLRSSCKNSCSHRSFFARFCRTFASSSVKISLMKTLLTFFILFFSYSVVAEDISDFEIEGISIGDSLLDHFSEEEIIKEIEENKYMYENLEQGRFGEVYKYEGLETYDYISFLVKIDLGSKFISKKNKRDNKFIIQNIRGKINFNDDIRGCKKQQNEIVKEFSAIFKNVKKIEQSWNDEEGKYNKVDFIFPSGGRIKVQCKDWKESITNEYGYKDGLDVVIRTDEVFQWMINY